MRINIIPVQELADQHLIAEYNEIKFSTDYYRRSLQTLQGVDRSRISKTYTLNTGHAYMWYDKFEYIMDRVVELCTEMEDRGFVAKHKGLDLTGVEELWNYGNFQPSIQEQKINVQRILLRIQTKIEEEGKETFYTMRRKVLTMQEWKDFYSKYL